MEGHEEDDIELTNEDALRLERSTNRLLSSDPVEDDNQNENANEDFKEEGEGELSQDESIRREEDIWKTHTEITQAERKKRMEERERINREIQEKAAEKKKKNSLLGPLIGNSDQLQKMKDATQKATQKFKTNIEQSFNKAVDHIPIPQDVKLILTNRKTEENDDYVAFEGIERVKVNSWAAKAMSKSTNKSQMKKRNLMYWFMCFEIGFLVGLTEFLNHEGLAQIQNGRIKFTKAIMSNGGPGWYVAAWLAYSLSAVAATMFGCALCVYVAPIAKGGGIAEVKAYLNGVKIGQLLELKTGLVKLISTMCAVGAGLCVGQEGPMIHMGSVVGYACSQMKFKAFPRVSSYFRKFQNDRDARDFVAAGAAAGVSAAFRSPIGATLFSLEEAASFWSHHLIWRTFFCCMVAAWSTNFFVQGRELGIAKLIDNPSHVVYQVALGSGFKLWELLCFMALGVIGGLLGAFFIFINLKINAYRKKTYYKHNVYKFLELAIITFVTATLSYVSPFASPCRLIDDDLSNLNNGGEVQNSNLEVQVFESFWCDEKTEYNPMASLTFANSEIALKHLFIQSNPKAFGGLTLFCYSLFYYILMAITAGTWIAAGLLVPQLICGAAIGRFYGYCLVYIGIPVDPGVYALLGASAFMAGVSRLTIALVIIMIEITNDLEALLPIMTVCMISKWVGDMFNHSIYDEQLHANHIPFLEPDPPRVAGGMSCKEAMIADKYHVPEMATVEQCYIAMKDQKHKNIPVVDTGDDGNRMHLKGSIPRSHLAILLQEKAYERRGLVDVVNTKLKTNAITFTPEEMKMKVDLRPYTNVATFSVQEDFPLYLAYRTFRDRGLREMFVVNDRNEIRGVITRPQLTSIHDAAFQGPGFGTGGHHVEPPQPLRESQSNTRLGNLRRSISTSISKATGVNLSGSMSMGSARGPLPRHGSGRDLGSGTGISSTSSTNVKMSPQSSFGTLTASSPLVMESISQTVDLDESSDSDSNKKGYDVRKTVREEDEQ